MYRQIYGAHPTRQVLRCGSYCWRGCTSRSRPRCIARRSSCRSRCVAGRACGCGRYRRSTGCCGRCRGHRGTTGRGSGCSWRTGTGRRSISLHSRLGCGFRCRFSRGHTCALGSGCHRRIEYLHLGLCRLRLLNFTIRIGSRSSR
jgi:hypothetical protein